MQAVNRIAGNFPEFRRAVLYRIPKLDKDSGLAEDNFADDRGKALAALKAALDKAKTECQTVGVGARKTALRSITGEQNVLGGEEWFKWSERRSAQSLPAGIEAQVR